MRINSDEDYSAQLFKIFTGSFLLKIVYSISVKKTNTKFILFDSDINFRKVLVNRVKH